MTVVAGHLEDRVTEILTRYSMLAPGAKVGVAVSGGADSVALLHLLNRLRYKVFVLHVNHQLRGAESDADQDFVGALAKEMGVPFEATQSGVGAGNLEQAAREGRRRFFLEAMGRLQLEKVALGHQRSDQAETVLYRLLRGSGLSGLAGMRPVTPEGFIRPLLTVGRDEIRSWASGQGIRWREDSSNQNCSFSRNHLRREMIPALAERFNSQLEAVLANNAVVAQAEEEWWAVRMEASYRHLAKRNALGSFFPVADLVAFHPAEQRRFLRKAVLEVKGNLKSVDLDHIEAIRKIIGSEAGHDRVLIPGVDALRSFGTLLLSQPGTLANAPRHYQVEAKLGEEALLPFGLGAICVNPVKTAGPICANFGVDKQGDGKVCYLDGDLLFRDNLAGFLSIRNWEPGDEMQRTATGKPEKLKLLFQEFRIPLWERRSWPVVWTGNEIVWSRCFGIQARFGVSDGSRNILRLSYRVDPGG